MRRTKTERRNEALERTRDYSWKNSKAKRLGKEKSVWEKATAKHIDHLESIKTY